MGKKKTNTVNNDSDLKRQVLDEKEGILKEVPAEETTTTTTTTTTQKNQTDEVVREENSDEPEVEIPETLTKVLTMVEGEKPWYLTTSEIYRLVKDASHNIPQSETLVRQSLSAILALSKKIESATSTVLVTDDIDDLIDRLDNVVGNVCTNLDDGVDNARGELVSTVRRLMHALSSYKINVVQQPSAIASEVASRYENFRVVLTSLVAEVRQRALTVKDTATSAVTSVMNDKAGIVAGVQRTAESAIVYSLSQLLTIARPYVQDAVAKGIPILEEKLTAYDSYIQQARPYVEPVAAKALAVNESLQKHALVGDYVSRANSFANRALTETKSYCVKQC